MPDLKLPSPLDAKPFKDSAFGPVLVGGLAALVLMAAVAAWSSTMSVASAAITSGKVTVEGSRKAVQHPNGGEVGIVFVREGQLVEKGEKLIQLELADAKAEATVLANNRIAALFHAARLETERADSSEMVFPSALLAQKSDPQIQLFHQQELGLLAARRSAYLGQINFLRQQIDGSRRQVEGLHGRTKTTQAQLDSIEEELKSLQPLLDKGLVARPRVLGLDRSASSLRGDIVQIANLIVAEDDKARAAEIQIAQLTKDRLESIAKDTAENDARLSEIVPRLASALRRMEQAVIVAPEGGYVYGLSVFGPGASLTPSQTVLEIVPKDQPMVISVEIEPTDIARVRPGQNASVHFLPYRQRYAKAIEGTLEKVSADRFEDPATKKYFYKGIVKVAPDAIEEAKVEMLPGMPAQVTIETGKRTILAYFLDPVFKIYDFALKEQ
ncbi:HlyD family type I secretion periplasmic adaptor subunit [Microvirga antarctica]|uniref:HlyD family type I secretion periplasmic adaptor subunit n=1 Tax=Microvirga antarctica TaxID=2819233 RepID=UPI001B30BD0D|nr:HlyD family type I secretion periplasmic adaptor subunit [Microvirga antarctica]